MKEAGGTGAPESEHSRHEVKRETRRRRTTRTDGGCHTLSLSYAPTTSLTPVVVYKHYFICFYTDNEVGVSRSVMCSQASVKWLTFLLSACRIRIEDE